MVHARRLLRAFAREFQRYFSGALGVTRPLLFLDLVSDGVGEPVSTAYTEKVFSSTAIDETRSLPFPLSFSDSS